MQIHLDAIQIVRANSDSIKSASSLGLKAVMNATSNITRVRNPFALVVGKDGEVYRDSFSC